MIELFVSPFVTFVVIIDPPGCAPIFASLTTGATAANRRAMAIRAVLVASAILFVFALFVSSIGVAGCFAGGARSGSTVWDSLAQCESGGRWSANTGNGYYGGLQFSLSTWQAYGGSEFAYWPYEATREQQIIIAQRVQAAQGWGAWPYCSSQLGLR